MRSSRLRTTTDLQGKNEDMQQFFKKKLQLSFLCINNVDCIIILPGCLKLKCLGQDYKRFDSQQCRRMLFRIRVIEYNFSAKKYPNFAAARGHPPVHMHVPVPFVLPQLVATLEGEGAAIGTALEGRLQAEGGRGIVEVAGMHADNTMAARAGRRHTVKVHAQPQYQQFIKTLL